MDFVNICPSSSQRGKARPKAEYGGNMAEIWQKRHRLPLLPYSFRETAANFAEPKTGEKTGSHINILKTIINH